MELMTGSEANATSSPKVWFVSDPLCSWCWGMACEIDLVREALSGKLKTDLMLGGLGFHNKLPMHLDGWTRLGNLWANVTATTGQQFRTLSDDEPEFVFNSQEACRAVLAVAKIDTDLVFDYLHALQRAFFIEGRHSTSLLVQLQEAQTLGISGETFTGALEQITDRTMDAALQQSRGHGSSALPAVLIENSQGVKKLVTAGYVTAEYLLPDLRHWLGE